MLPYRVMYVPEWPEGCSRCTAYADWIAPGAVRHVAEQGTALALAWRASFEQLDARRQQHG